MSKRFALLSLSGVLLFITILSYKTTYSKNSFWGKRIKNDSLSELKIRTIHKFDNTSVIIGHSKESELKIIEKSISIEKVKYDYKIFRLLLESSFTDSRAPYAGTVSKTTTCPNNKIRPIDLPPTQHPFKMGSIVTTDANKHILRCSSNKKFYSLLDMTFYCPSSQHSYTIKLYTKNMNYEHLLQVYTGFECIQVLDSRGTSHGI